jgi:hypothetical protein
MSGYRSSMEFLVLKRLTILVDQVADAGRPWRIAEELDVNIFHTSPIAAMARTLILISSRSDVLGDDQA